MTIPFVRVYPSGKRRRQDIACSGAIEARARVFIAAGGRYVVEILPTGEACLTALFPSGEDWKDVAHGKCANGPELPTLVDEVITRSVAWLGPIITTWGSLDPRQKSLEAEAARKGQLRLGDGAAEKRH